MTEMQHYLKRTAKTASNLATIFLVATVVALLFAFGWQAALVGACLIMGFMFAIESAIDRIALILSIAVVGLEERLKNK